MCGLVRLSLKPSRDHFGGTSRTAVTLLLDCITRLAHLCLLPTLAVAGI